MPEDSAFAANWMQNDRRFFYRSIFGAWNATERIVIVLRQMMSRTSEIEPGFCENQVSSTREHEKYVDKNRNILAKLVTLKSY
jgi:hypothetical protein